MESKMNVIDIIPCNYMVPFTKASEVFNKNSDTTSGVDALTPQISYGQAVTEFQEVCRNYGLDSSFGGLRVFLTDQTTATDDFTNTYTDNYLTSKYNSLFEFTKKMRDVGRSVSSNWDATAREITAQGGEKVGTKLGDLYEDLTGTDVGLGGKLEVLMGAVGAAVGAGDRIALPKVWSDSNYNPSINAVVKLVSPYGHPDAIKEFVIKPLMYLLIMASPRTRDGISYGHSPKVTIKGYGMVHLPLAHISNVNLRKGGDDTSFNIYKQPLSIDVSLQFESLISGFASFTGTGESKLSEGGEYFYKDTSKVIRDFGDIKAGKRAFFSTLGTVVDSIRPVAMNHIITSHNIQDLPGTPGIKKLAENDKSPELWRPSQVPPQLNAITGNEDSMADANRQNTTTQSDSTVASQYNIGGFRNLSDDSTIGVNSQTTGLWKSSSDRIISQMVALLSEIPT
jgi:hypothetical protein